MDQQVNLLVPIFTKLRSPKRVHTFVSASIYTCLEAGVLMHFVAFQWSQKAAWDSLVKNKMRVHSGNVFLEFVVIAAGRGSSKSFPAWMGHIARR